MKVLLDTSPLSNANSIRGVGVYTRFLSQELEKLEDQAFEIFTSFDEVHEQVAARGNVDIVHYPFFDLFFHTLPITFGVKKDKTVVTIHDVIPLLYPYHYRIGIRGRVHHFLQRQALAQVDAVITDSEASKADIVRLLNVPKQKVHVVYLAGNPEIKALGTRHLAIVKDKYSLPERFILYVGDINYNKNIPQLVKALTLVDKSVHLVCVGRNFHEQNIPEWNAIESAISTNRLQNRIHFVTELGSEASHDLSAIYSMAKCYVQPSLYEGFGLPVLEALQCEAPVVCAKNSSLIEIGGEVVQFVNTDYKSIAEGIEKVIINSDHYKSATWKAKVKRHLQQFSWQKTAQQTKDIYFTLL